MLWTMPDQPGTSSRRDAVHGHPLRDALLTLIDRDGMTTSTIAARELGESTGACSFHLRRLEEFGVIEPVPEIPGRGKPWRRVSATQATLNRELEDVAYATWLTKKESEGEDFAFSEVVSLTEGDLAELRARLQRVLRDFTETRSTPQTTSTAVIIRAFPLRD
jgi:predicted ArsR family transcriptional regulator